MGLFDIGKKTASLVGKGKEGHLFIAYNLDTRLIEKVWRTEKDDATWDSFQMFVEQQIERVSSLMPVPDEMYYYFKTPDIEKIPMLTPGYPGIREFVQQLNSYMVLSVDAALLSIKEGIPVETLKNTENISNKLAVFSDNKNEKEDLYLFEKTVSEDSYNYEKIAALVQKYDTQCDITKRQMEILNSSPYGLRIYAAVEEFIRYTDYYKLNDDVDDFESLLGVTVDKRTPLHILSAELIKVDMEQNALYSDREDYFKRLFEIRMYVCRVNISKDWQLYPIPEEWKKIACAQLNDVKAVEREIDYFSFVPELTRVQLEYLIRTGTSSITLARSGIMGNVIMLTPFFRQRYGVRLEMFDDNERISSLDDIIFRATEAVAEISLRAYEKDSMETEKEIAGEILNDIRKFREKRANAAVIQNRTSILTRMREILERMARENSTDIFQGLTDERKISHSEEFEDLIRTNYDDDILSVEQIKLVMEYCDKIPSENVSAAITLFSGQKYGKSEDNANLNPSDVLLSYQQNPTVLKELVLKLQLSKVNEQLLNLKESRRGLTREKERIISELNDKDDEILRKETQARKISFIVNKTINQQKTSENENV